MARDGVHGEGDQSGCDQGKRSITQDLQAAPRCALTSSHMFALVPGASKAVACFQHYVDQGSLLGFRIV